MSQDPSTLYPLLFEPIYKEKVWGGRTLEKLGRNLPGGADTLIGESWELADLAQTSASGGGGGAERSVIANGPLAGKTLAEVIKQFGKQVIGDVKLTDSGGFPILLKFLDAGEHLSVQVHPNADYAATHDDAFLKSEAWYVLDAKPGAVIFKGVKAGTSPKQFRKAIERNEVQPLLIAVEVKPGDCHYLPSGTCHALGAGVMVAEVQTPSDTTFRVYDWGRTGRELHIEQAMQCIEFGPAQTQAYEVNMTLDGMFGPITRLVTCEHFNIDRYQITEAGEHKLSYDQPVLWMVLEGGGTFTGAGQPDVVFTRGQTLFLPPGMGEVMVTIEAGSTLLEVTFPGAKTKSMA